MGSDQVLQIRIHAVLKNSKKSVTDCIDLADLAWLWCRKHGWGIWLSNNGGLILGDFQSIFVQCLRNILLPDQNISIIVPNGPEYMSYFKRERKSSIKSTFFTCSMNNWILSINC